MASRIFSAVIFFNIVSPRVTAIPDPSRPGSTHDSIHDTATPTVQHTSLGLCSLLSVVTCSPLGVCAGVYTHISCAHERESRVRSPG